MEDKQTSLELQLHYYFTDKDSHSMNAEIFNDCERQFIQAIKSMNKYLDTVIEIEVFAKQEGGIKDNFKVIIKHPTMQGVFIALVSAWAIAFFTSQLAPKVSITEEVKSKFEIQSSIKEAIKNDQLTPEEFDYIAQNDKDLKKLKSGFFKSAKRDTSILQIEVNRDSKTDDKNTLETIAVPYKEFDNFILKDEEEKDETEVDIKIFIIAPILVKGRRDYWKGYSDEESIEFRVSDKDFLEQVYEHDIKFSNGSFINCKMKTIITMKKEKNVVSVYREVVEVFNWGEDDKFVKPIARHNKKSKDDRQQSLFSEDAFSKDNKS